MSIDEINAALYGKKRGRIQVAPKEERTAWVDILDPPRFVVFHSKGEMFRYYELRASLKAGIIRELELQPKFPIKINNIKVCDVILDFRYIGHDGNVCIEDFKGMRTDMYALKSKLFHAYYPLLRIVEVLK